jgi:hypothetical protein
MPDTLYKRLGGYDAIAAVCDDLLPRKVGLGSMRLKACKTNVAGVGTALLFGGTESSNPVPSSAESCANQTVLTQAVIPPYVFLRRILPWFR